MQPRTPGKRTRETWRLRPGALTSLSPAPFSRSPPGLSPPPSFWPPRTCPPLLDGPQVPERCSTPPPGLSVERNHRPLPPPFPARICAATSSRGALAGVRTGPERVGEEELSASVGARGPVLPRDPSSPSDSSPLGAPVRRGGPAPGAREGGGGTCAGAACARPPSEPRSSSRGEAGGCWWGPLSNLTGRAISIPLLPLKHPKTEPSLFNVYLIFQ